MKPGSGKPAVRRQLGAVSDEEEAAIILESVEPMKAYTMFVDGVEQGTFSCRGPVTAAVLSRNSFKYGPLRDVHVEGNNVYGIPAPGGGDGTSHGS